MQELIGPYRVEGELGRGGMGVVYRALDTRLDREVAIKALPEELAGDAGRLERFEREAKTLASLNHPNVAGILGIEEQSGAKYLVLEFVDGETLAARLDRGPIAVDEAIELAVQIASGVEAAHEAGVIHRDLKPANIKVTPEGVVKVLDFGLAKADEGHTSGSSLSQMPTQTSPAKSPTMEGAILGTAAYMSPEQARGRRVDKRSDIWSFGVVVYEMLCGASPFIGETATDSIGAILHKDLDLDRLPRETPAGVRRVLSRCVERDKSQRYRDIGDVRVELLRAKDEPAVSEAGAAGLGVVQYAVLAILVLAIGAGSWFGAVLTRPEAAPVVTKMDLVVASETEPLGSVEPRISPDGRRVAYLAEGVIQIRDLNSFEARALSGTEDAESLFWSPDGEWIGYTKGRGVYKLRVAGGGAIKVCDTEDNAIEMTTGGWTEDGRIVYRGEKALYEVPARGGEPRVWLAQGEGETDFHQVRSVSGTNAMVFVTHLKTMTGLRVEAYDGTRRVVIVESDDEVIGSVSYSPTGHVLYSRGFADPALWAVGFDVGTMTVTGEPFQIVDGASVASVSRDGTLLMKRGALMAMGGTLVWVDPLEGSVTPLGMGEDLEVMAVGNVSPDGRRVAVLVGDPTGGDAWVLDLERKSSSRLTFEDGFMAVIGWSPDGAELATCAFNPASEIGDMETTFFAADGTGPTREPIAGIVIGFDRDWKIALVRNDFRSGSTVVTRVMLDGSAEPEVVYEDDESSFGTLMGGELSPDGDLMLLTDRSSGNSEVFCIRLDGGRGRYQVSTSGGRTPRWSPDGKWVYFKSYTDDIVMRVPFERDVPEGGGLATVRFGMPEQVMDMQELALNPNAEWTFGPGEERLLAVKSADAEEGKRSSLSVVTNWFEEFRER